MQQYLDILRRIRTEGRPKPDRTGTGTISVFGHHLRLDLTRGFPLLTTKKLHLKSIVHELLWFLSGDTNVQYLQEHGVRIWNDWADEAGELGPVYGAQWRRWQADGGRLIDQFARVVEQIRTDPYSRRHIVSAWNVGELDKMALPPCHLLFQFYVIDNRLSCQLYMRSVDTFLGLPFNIASYSLLTHMVAQQCDLEAAEFLFCGGDCHIYSNHVAQVDEQLGRQPYPLPTLELKRRPPSLFDYRFEDIAVTGYRAHPHIKAPIAV